MSYDVHADRMNARANQELETFLAKSRGPARKILLQLPDAEALTHSRFASCDVSDIPLAAPSEDLAEAVDSMEDMLEEQFGISPSLADRIAGWHRSVVAEEVEREKAVQLNRMASLLIRPSNDLKAVVYGLCLAAGLSDLNGVKSGADVSRALGKHRATISFWKRTWQKLLGLRNETYGKNDVAKEKYRVARYRVLQRGKSL